MSNLFERYSHLLQEHVNQPDEAHLAAASEMGQEMVLSGIPPEEMAELQQEALSALLESAPNLSLSQIALPMSALQTEMLMAYGLVFREQLEERKRVEAQIRQSLREKELLLEEIHHRVKNNLQIMSSLFNLQMRFTQEPTALKILKESQSRIRSMALIHEKLYHSEDLEHLDFADYLKSLSTYLSHLYDMGSRVTLKLEISPLNLGMDKAIPCGILVTELVSNALKHAFPEADPNKRSGEILIQLTQPKPQFAELSVSDNGIGLVQKPDFKKAKTLGWHLIKTLSGQIDGELKIQIQNGTQVKILFPLKTLEAT